MVIFSLILLGLCLGSFVNALVWRLYKQQLAKNKKQQAAYSITSGRSMCVHCHHQLAWNDLLPVLSWLSLKGRCRYCHKPISWQYPLVELMTAVLFAGSYVFWPSTLHSPLSILQFCLWLVLLVGFVALAVYDLRWMLLPDRIVKPLQFIALIYAAINIYIIHNHIQAALGTAWGLIMSAGLFYILYQVSRGKWIGGGDVKLAVVLGLTLGGPAKAILMIFLAATLGSAISLPLMLTRKLNQSSRIPFGPLLLIATIIVHLFGASIIGWYQQQFLFV